MVSQSNIINKALKLSKSILMDDQVTLSPSEKEAYTKFEGSNGWIDKFKGRYQLTRRFITTKCSKNMEEMRPLIQEYLKELNGKIDALNNPKVFNMDETCLFFELTRGQTMEVKGKKIIGGFSSGKEKEKVSLLITVSDDGHLLPPFVIFKASKPRNKTFKDYPTEEKQKFQDQAIEEAVTKEELLAYRTYSGWNNKRIMMEYFVPYFLKHCPANHLLILDNHGSHVSNQITSVFDEKNIKYLHHAPNSTLICQPVDVEIAAAIKAKIKSYFENWLVESWEEEGFYTFNEKKNKYKYKAPTRELIIKWVLLAYEETSKQTILNGKIFYYCY